MTHHRQTGKNIRNKSILVEAHPVFQVDIQLADGPIDSHEAKNLE